MIIIKDSWLVNTSNDWVCHEQPTNHWSEATHWLIIFVELRMSVVNAVIQ